MGEGDETMKSILMSIKPKWIEKIARGEKTVEARKSVPKYGTQFKVYMYCTKEGRGRNLRLHINDKKGREDVGITTWWRDGKDVLKVNDHLPAYRFNSHLAEGKVVGEFVCDHITAYTYDTDCGVDITDDDLEEAMLDREDINIYANGQTIYGLHISDLKIYDKPKDLEDFRVPCIKDCKKCSRYVDKGGFGICHQLLERPPQSWCYVEEL